MANTIALRSFIIACWLCVLTASCITRPSLPSPPELPNDDADFRGDPLPPKPGLVEAAEDEPEKLEPGDILGVKFIGANGLDQPSLRVDRSGHVHLPLIGNFAVSGHTIDEAEHEIQTALTHYDKFARVSLNLIDDKARTAVVSGAVERPGNYPLIGDARLAQLLSAAGGPKIVASTIELNIVELGDIDGTRVIRKGVPLPIDARLAMQGDARHNVRVRPGDVIVVPPALNGRIVVLGHVNRARSLPFRTGMRLSEALADAGGLIVKTADSGDIRIIRGGYAKPKVFVTDLKQFALGNRRDVILAPGDVIYVSEHWFASVGEVLDRLIPLAGFGIVAAAVVPK